MALCGSCSHSAFDGNNSDAGSAGYSACWIIGGLDRLFIFKRDDSKQTCTRLRLLSPSSISSLPVSAPDGWALEEGAISNQPDDCSKTGTLSSGSASASTGTGAISWPSPDASSVPLQLDVHVVLGFTSSGTLPTADRLDADAVHVSSCL